jgi:hypothetical protein
MSKTLTKDELRAVVAQVGYTGELLETMTDLAWRESACMTSDGWRADPDARGRMDAGRGLFQIDARLWADRLIAEGIIAFPDDLFNPSLNARAARYIEQQIGVDAWPSLARYPAPRP